MMEHEIRQEIYQYHTANALSILANITARLGGGKDLDYPMFTDLIHKNKSNDNRTAAEIKADILAKFTG